MASRSSKKYAQRRGLRVTHDESRRIGRPGPADLRPVLEAVMPDQRGPGEAGYTDPQDWPDKLSKNG